MIELYPKSVVEVVGIVKDAAVECFYDARLAIGRVISKADEWMADYGDEEWKP